MTKNTYSVQDGYGYYIAESYSHAVSIAHADEATACTLFKNGKAVAFKPAGSTVIDLLEVAA
jgi:hypothetical protein